MFWRLRTGLMFVVMTLILVALGSIVGALFNSFAIGLIVMLAVSVLIGFYSYYFSKSSALRANKVVLVTEAEEPRLYAIVKNLTEKAGMPMPEVGISQLAMPNAFATGRNPNNAAVVATRGLMNLLPDDELEGVFAHELSHVKNRDILVMSVASTMASVISYTARFGTYMMIFSSDRENRGAMMALAMILNLTVPIAAVLVQLGVSRNREYLADETGGRMCGNPRALARALRRIETGCATTEEVYANKSYADVWISSPLKGRSKTLFSSIFSTHPSTEDRIERLNNLADKLDEEKREAMKNSSPKNKSENEDYLY